MNLLTHLVCIIFENIQWFDSILLILKKWLRSHNK
jgi:hypothetical protein